MPISELAPNCPASDPGVGGSPNCTIGVWSTADRPRITTRVGLSSLTNPGGEEGSGGYVQVSRLGMPLTNEVVIPLALKDAFNALKPELDQELFTGAAPFTPEIGALVQRFRAGMIANARGDQAAAQEYLQQALAINPYFSVLYAPQARTLLEQLNAK